MAEDPIHGGTTAGDYPGRPQSATIQNIPVGYRTHDARTTVCASCHGKERAAKTIEPTEWVAILKDGATDATCARCDAVLFAPGPTGVHGRAKRAPATPTSHENRQSMPGTHWPQDESEPLELQDLVRPLRNAIRTAYTLERNSLDVDVPWTGPEGTGIETTGCLENAEALSAENLRYQEEEQEEERDTLWLILGIAIRLGCEEGRRIDRERAGPKPFDPELDAIADKLTREAVTRRRAELEKRGKQWPLPEKLWKCGRGRCNPTYHELWALAWCSGEGVAIEGWWCDECRKGENVPDASVHGRLSAEFGWAPV